MAKIESVNVQGTEVSVLTHRKDDYISLTDMAKYKNAETTGLVISHWLSTRYNVEFMGIWEKINNPTFNVTEFSNIRIECHQCQDDWHCCTVVISDSDEPCK